MGDKKLVTIKIDGQEIKAKLGANLLQVARENDIAIPGLCYHPRLSPTAACRLCVVKINGSSYPEPACSQEVTAGMEVIAFDEELENYRRNLVDLMLSQHNYACIDCEMAGNCQLQDLGYHYGLVGLSSEKFCQVYDDVNRRYQKFAGFKKQYPEKTGSNRTETYTGKPADCIRCGYCIEVCPMELYPVLIMEAREYQQEKLLEELQPEECIKCGLCSYVCPGKISIPDYFPEDREVK